MHFHGKQRHMQKLFRSRISFVFVIVICQENNSQNLVFFYMYVVFLWTVAPQRWGEITKCLFNAACVDLLGMFAVFSCFAIGSCTALSCCLL